MGLKEHCADAMEPRSGPGSIPRRCPLAETPLAEFSGKAAELSLSRPRRMVCIQGMDEALEEVGTGWKRVGDRTQPGERAYRY
jgi:hypothetical protein